MLILFHFQTLKQSSTELLFGGHETTASAATSLITYLGLYPHVLQKVREELKSKVRDSGGSLLRNPHCFPISVLTSLSRILKCRTKGWVDQWVEGFTLWIKREES